MKNACSNLYKKESYITEKNVKYVITIKNIVKKEGDLLWQRIEI